MAKETTRNGRDDTRPERGASAPSASSATSAYPSLQPLGRHKHLPPIPINRSITMIGSRRTARIHLSSTQVSKAHALIVMTPTQAYICDLLSRGGTKVKGHAVKELELRDGDDIQLGDFEFQFNDPRPRQKAPPPAVEPLALQFNSPAGSRRVVLERRVTLIGRRAGSDVDLPFPNVSTSNTAIVRLDGFAGEGKSMGFVGWGVFDLGGKGTQLNGVPIHKERIRAGDVITIGRARVDVVSLLQTERAPERPAATRAPIPVPDAEPAMPAIAAALVHSTPISEQPVTADDLDAIDLDEELTPEGMEEDLLGGSHVMDAIAEPDLAPAPLDATLPATEQLSQASLAEILDVPEGEELDIPSGPHFENAQVEQRPAYPYSDVAPTNAAPEPAIEASSEPGETEPVAAWSDPELEQETCPEAQPIAEVDLSHIDFGTARLRSTMPDSAGPGLRQEDATQVADADPGHRSADHEHAPAEPLLSAAQSFDARHGFAGRSQLDQVEVEPTAAVDEAQWEAPVYDMGGASADAEVPPPVPAAESELVMTETEPTPQSALDLELLSAEPAEETFEHAPAPALSDSVFALELEALTEEGGMYGPAPGETAAPDEPDPGLIEQSGASSADTTLAQTAESEGEWQPEAEAGIDWIANLESEPRTAGDEANEPWTSQLLEQAAEATAADPGSPVAEDKVEHVDALDEEESVPGPWDDDVPPPGDTEDAQAPGAPAAFSGEVHAQRHVPADQPATFSALPDSGTAADQPPKPRKVGFAGVVAEIESPTVPDASTPFSSRPVGGVSAFVLDPSAAMPDELPFEPVESDPRTEAVAPLAGASAPARGPAVSDQEEALGEDIWSRLPTETARAVHEHFTNGAQSGNSTNGAARAPADARNQAAANDFLNTIRAGVRGNSADNPFADGNGDGNDHPEAAPASPPVQKPRGSVRKQVDWAAGVDPHVEPPVADDVQTKSRSRLLWQVPLMMLVGFVAAAAAAGAIWYGMPPTVTVTMKLRYDIRPDLTLDEQKAYQDGQRSRLVEDSVRKLALECLKDRSPEVAPGFLEDVIAYNRFALKADWSTQEPALLLRRDVPALERAAESARLKAVATALFNAGATERTAMEQHNGQIEQLGHEIDESLRHLDDLTRQIEEATARLPLPRDDASDVVQEQQLEEHIVKLDEQWSAASRQAVELRQQVSSIQQADPLADDRQLAELNRRLTDLEAQIAIFRRRGPPSDEPAESSTFEKDLIGAFPAALLFDGAALQSDEARPAAGEIDAARSAEAPPAPRFLLGPRPAGAPLQAQVEALLKQADAAASGLSKEPGQQLTDEASGFSGTVAHLIDETLPGQVRAAGEVELLRQALLRTRRHRAVALLDEDVHVRSLRAEAALKERELSAAISDGLTDKVVALRMALRLTRDRLSMRVDDVSARLEDDTKVIEVRKAYENALKSARDSLVPARAQFERALASHRRAVNSLTPSATAPALAKAMQELESAARAIVDEHADRLPLLAEVWVPAEPNNDDVLPAPSPAEAPAAGDEQELSFVHMVGQEPPIPATQPSLEEQAAELRRLIAARQTELRDAQARNLSELREQLSGAEAAAAKAQREAQQARGQLGEMRAGQESAIRERQRVSQLRMEKVDLEGAIDENQRELKRLRGAAGQLSTPLPPSDVDLTVPVAGHDQRPRLMLIAVSAVGVLTLLGLFLTLRGSARE